MKIEIERTYLLKYFPKDLNNYPFKDYLDIYFPTSAFHPIIRVRKRGNDCEITKKYAIKAGDASQQYEFTIPLTVEEFNELENSIKGKRSHKHRYFYQWQGLPAEIDIYQDNLKGLNIVDFEFNDPLTKDKFEMPDFCLIEVTQEKNLAGGMIVGKNIQQIQPILDKYGYKPFVSS